ncbi:hypothetical protein G6F46_013639 [Rhizopus delemar]|nr:hypothetical protein G6F46_013639 [Rhizopus delemar]
MTRTSARSTAASVASSTPACAVAAVLPGFDPAGADGGHRAGRGRVASLDPGPGREAGKAAVQPRRHRQLRVLCRHRLAALLPAAGPAAAGDQLRPVRGAGQGHQVARKHPRLAAARGDPEVPGCADARDPPGERPAGRLPGADAHFR